MPTGDLNKCTEAWAEKHTKPESLVIIKGHVRGEGYRQKVEPAEDLG